MTLVRGVTSALSGGEMAKQWFQKLNAELFIDDEHLPMRPYTAILAASIHEIGVGFRALHRCTDVPGAYHALLLDCRPVQFPSGLPYFYFGRPLHPRLGEERTPTRIDIHADRPWKYTIDGDMHTCESGQMVVETGPKLTVIRR